MTDLSSIADRLDAVRTDEHLSDVIRDVEARLEVEHADAGVREAVAALARRARQRIYGGLVA